MTKVSKGEQTRGGIVNCAKHLFYEKGYDGTSFSDIVEASGLHRGNIYHYFKTKDDILKAVIDSHLEEFRSLLHTWENKHTAPKERLHAFVGMITQRKSDLIQYGCPIGSLNTELGKNRRDLQVAARTLFDLFLDWITAQFIELGHSPEAKSLALHLLGRAQGIAVISHVYQDARLLQREIRQVDRWIDELSEQRGEKIKP